MKKIRLLAMLLVVCIAAVSFAGCKPANTANDKDEQGRTVISVGGWPAKKGEKLDKMNARKEKFEEDNPDIAIVPDTWSYDIQSFYSKASAGQLPTVYSSVFTEIEKIISGGYGADLTEGLKRAGYEGKFNEAVMKIISRDGKIYTFPDSTYALGLAYNVDLFEKAGLMNEDGTPMQPKDWDEVVEFGKKITKATGKAGFIIPTMNNFGGWLFTPIAWSFGTEFMKAEGENKYRATFDSKEFAAALKYISDLKWKHDILIDNTLIDMDEYYKQFALGNAGMMLALNSFTDYVYKYEMPLENIGYMAIPAGPVKHVTLTGGWTTTINANATEDQIDAAIKWIEAGGSGYNLSENAKKTMEENMKLNAEQKKAIGIESLSVYNEESERVNYSKELIKKYATLDLNHVKLYNDSLYNSEIELKPEEPVCTQDLYAVIDGLIQEVLTNENADIDALIKTANAEFQKNYLDKLD